MMRLCLATAVWYFTFLLPISAEPIDVGSIVEASGIDEGQATVVVKRLSDGQIWMSNDSRADIRFSPASTSKIPHTLIALEEGYATTDTPFAWDGIVRSSRAWNQNQTLKTAFQTSAVWVYQKIAEDIGLDVMSRKLTEYEYGNMAVGTALQPPTYWLDDTLRISAREQIEFLTKFALTELPVSPATYAAAKDIMVHDQANNWVMRAKTGWRHADDSMDIGWFVGTLECGDETYVFAMNMDMPDTRYLSKRTEIVFSVLEDIGAFDCG